ncbi:hypothetical protein ANRL1_03677 [Anaerolineae bacterium]|nr:hypothetical protein ANRL1_03677 [Anaerolineae bacterium]
MKETYRVGKGTGEINHMERWNNTLRQSYARYVRKTLSFAKSDFYHELVTHFSLSASFKGIIFLQTRLDMNRASAENRFLRQTLVPGTRC